MRVTSSPVGTSDQGAKLSGVALMFARKSARSSWLSYFTSSALTHFLPSMGPTQMLSLSRTTCMAVSK